MRRDGIRFDTAHLCGLIDERIGRNEFAQAMGVGEGRLSCLLDGSAQFRQAEMNRAAALLRLDPGEFGCCFFTVKVQKF